MKPCTFVGVLMNKTNVASSFPLGGVEASVSFSPMFPVLTKDDGVPDQD